MRRFVLQLVGDPRQVRLEHRIYNTIMLLGACFALLSASVSAAQLQGLGVVAGNLAVLPVTGLLYGMCRFRGKMLGAPLVALSILVLSLGWFSYGGSQGGTMCYFVTVSVLFALFARGWARAALVVLFVGALAALLVVEARDPAAARTFASPQERLMDVGSSVVAATAITALIVSAIVRNYDLERKRSEQLLLNVLPVRVAHELKHTGETLPVVYDPVTVLLSDFVGFTALCERLPPKELIDELNVVFTEFDNILERHGCERIKTIGDAYLGVCGVAERTPDHAHRMLAAAQELVGYLAERNRTAKVPLEVRIGIASGPVVGGVVGIRKYVFDVFGDTVNTAQRMEAHCEPMRVNVSEDTYAEARDHCSFEPRGQLDVKGKGEIAMYYLAPGPPAQAGPPAG